MEALADLSGPWECEQRHHSGPPKIFTPAAFLAHLPVDRYWRPEEFMKLGELAQGLGFKPGALRTTGAQQLPRRRELRRHICQGDRRDLISGTDRQM